MAKPNEILRAFGDAVGVLGGGPRSVDAAGLAAKGAAGFSKLKSEIRDRLTRVGEVVGAHAGDEFLEALANGASRSSAAAVAAQQRLRFGISSSELKTGAIILGVLVLAAAALGASRG